MNRRSLLWMLVLVVVLTPSVIGEVETASPSIASTEKIDSFETAPIFITADSTEGTDSIFKEGPPERFVVITDVAASDDALIESYPALSYIYHAYRVTPVEESVLCSAEVTVAGCMSEQAGVGGEMPTRAVITVSRTSDQTESVPIYNVIDTEKTSPLSTPVYYAQEVPEGTGNLWVDLNWGKAEQNFSLAVWHPSGLLGTFKDADDGKKNGRIFLRISDEDGVEGGMWYYQVSGPRIPVALNYSFRTYVG